LLSQKKTVTGKVGDVRICNAFKLLQSQSCPFPNQRLPAGLKDLAIASTSISVKSVIFHIGVLDLKSNLGDDSSQSDLPAEIIAWQLATGCISRRQGKDRGDIQVSSSMTVLVFGRLMREAVTSANIGGTINRWEVFGSEKLFYRICKILANNFFSRRVSS
jgi:hypothetical protein